MKELIKKNLGKVMLFVAIIAAGSVNAQPQGGGQQQGPPPIPDAEQIEKMVSDLAGEIGMTESQETEILALYTDHFKTVESEMSSGSKPDRTEMEKLKTTFENKVKELLTEDQQTQYVAFLKKQESERPQRD